MQTIVLYQNQCVRFTNLNVFKRPSFLSLIYLCKRCVLSILEISHTNQIVLIFIYPDAKDKLDSGLTISRWYFRKKTFFALNLFSLFPDQQPQLQQSYSMRILIQKGFNSATTECPKIKLAFGKYLDIALHGFLMGIFNPKLFSPDSSGPHKLKQLLRYGGNKDNKPKWRLLNISAPG